MFDLEQATVEVSRRYEYPVIVRIQPVPYSSMRDGDARIMAAVMVGSVMLPVQYDLAVVRYF